MSDAAVKAKTGKTWTEWVRALDAEAMHNRPHSEIASYLATEFGVKGWWSQTVTVGYERIHGLRETGQRRDGTHDTNKSKTVNVPIETLYEAFANERLREQWLPEKSITIRKANKNRSIRMLWPDDTPVQAYFASKGPRKSSVAIQHSKLTAKSDAAKYRAYWTEHLNRLAEFVQSE